MAGWGSGGTPETVGGTATDTSNAHGVAAAIGGEGQAVGDETLTTGDATLDIVDRGPVTFVIGDASVSSTAMTPTEGQTSVQADTFASVTGADFVLAFTTHGSNAGTSDSGAWETATSTTRLFAFDIQGFDFAAGQQVVQIDLTRDVGDPHFPISGNVSAASADSDAVGDTTYTLAQTETLTTDSMSGVGVEAYGFIA